MLIIERFEGETAVIENDEHIEINRKLLPQDASEGDVIVKCGDGYSVDREQTAKRRERILKLQNSLWS